jgi:hypothetical protein
MEIRPAFLYAVAATPDATFTTDIPIFEVQGPATYNTNLYVDYTVGGWLNSTAKVRKLKFSGQVNPGINAVVTAKTLLSDGVGYGGTNGTCGTMIELTGNVDLGNEEIVSFSSSDGMSVNIDGQNVYQHSGPGPGNDSFFWTGTLGAHSVEFLFAECCGGGAGFAFTPYPNQKPARAANDGWSRRRLVTGTFTETGTSYLFS